MSKDKQKIAFLIAVGVIAGGLIAWQFIYKTSNSITSLKGDIKVQEKLIDEYQKKIDEIPKLMDERDLIEEVVEEFSRILPDDARREQIRLTAMIEDFKGESGIKFVKLQPRDRRKKPSPGGGQKGQQQQASAFERHTYELVIEGRFFDFVTLVNKIEKSQKFIKIDEFSCNRIQEKTRRPGGDLTYLTCRIVMSFYTYVPVVASAGTTKK